MTPDDFSALMREVSETIGPRPLNSDLDTFLNQAFPGDGDMVARIEQACRTGISEGWLCQNEHGGIRFGRPIKPSLAEHKFSVDVVVMDDCKGPHHAHPTGEIDLILPDDDGADFDGRGRGWLVYEPGTAHFPTVSGGKAIVLYLLPNGEIEFTRSKKG
ncbi:MAG: DUF4863 family protein [Alphaproteobacteria bacterium]|nr:DUF4863 family protein [Alphaproteobacteria bacterium]